MPHSLYKPHSPASCAAAADSLMAWLMLRLRVARALWCCTGATAAACCTMHAYACALAVTALHAWKAARTHWNGISRRRDSSVFCSYPIATLVMLFSLHIAP